ncbi:MAG TPA: phytoene/squalene synthase family protein [Prolixibacteraceae bacterium]|jgi:phytoene/squalene synthetase|nr:phytoene/squalene synthase family protein [Bacteroidales bacterium]HNQ36424.1 phytoene/squalene synthase family protein [Prolixibacteraceae bacterium]HOY52343.1 phytoene/squalene synthase family protein [Prolixibacteraceae bacterium]HPJ79970.1 phytoene/squalene synthase family protein [Prolixibacteraceae bacterium]HRV89474.1 phytoene/squalene synthase family protein [Prolixibacteraceae bacterium]
MDRLYERVSFGISRLITREYSTSFSSAVGLLPGDLREAIFSIYGFVRLADEIVDTFHEHDKSLLLEKFEGDYDDARERGISLNPVLHAFQLTVKRYGIEDAMIRAFLKSMKADLVKQEYLTDAELKEYIYGSADVVGLMCLKVFVRGNQALYEELEVPAMRLGTAFQKVNFLRDLRSDTLKLGRSYFPGYDENNFTDQDRDELVRDIRADFDSAYAGIRRLPQDVGAAVLVAWYYYLDLLRKISRTPAKILADRRIRVSNGRKLLLLWRGLIHWKLKVAMTPAPSIPKP